MTWGTLPCSARPSRVCFSCCEAHVLVAWASVVAGCELAFVALGLQSVSSVAAAHRLSCSAICGVLVHWSQPPALSATFTALSAGGCDPHTKRRRGATPRPRSGAEARRTPCLKGSGQEELPYVRGQGQWPRVPGCDGAGIAERSYPASDVRGGGQEELPCL